MAKTAQKIIVALGVEIRDVGQGYQLLQFLNANADAQRGSVWTYPKGAARGNATYEVSLVYTMPELAAALDTPDAYVIYEGHSRYGQGPAFGPSGTPHVPDIKTFPVNPWGVHFRMGYDATDTECRGDLLEHSVNPAEYDLTVSAPKAFLPASLITAGASVRAIEKKIKAGKFSRKSLCSVKGAWRLLSICDPSLANTKTARGDEPLKSRHYYAVKGKDYLPAVVVGSSDLDASSLKCKVLFMASCSSREHFLDALKRRRKATKSPCKFYMTAVVCAMHNAKNFIEQVFKGRDPTSKAGSKKMLKSLNGWAKAGIIGIY